MRQGLNDQSQVPTTYRVTRVSTSSSAVILAKLRASLKLAAAPCLAHSVGDRAGIDLGTRSGLVGALGGDEAREGRSGEDDGGVEHDACEVWRSGVARRQQERLRRNSQAVRWQGCWAMSMLTWVFVKRDGGINGRGATLSWVVRVLEDEVR